MVYIILLKGSYFQVRFDNLCFSRKDAWSIGQGHVCTNIIYLYFLFCSVHWFYIILILSYRDVLTSKLVIWAFPTVKLMNNWDIIKFKLDQLAKPCRLILWRQTAGQLLIVRRQNSRGMQRSFSDSNIMTTIMAKYPTPIMQKTSTIANSHHCPLSPLSEIL